MKVLRSMLGWFLMGLGVFALSIWASASFITHRVDSGSVASPFLSTVLHQPQIQQTIAEQTQSLVVDQLAQNGVNVAGTPDEAALSAAIAATVSSESFIDDLTALIEEVESSVIAQLTDDTLPLAPLTISVDVTQPLYTALAKMPEVAALVPPTTLAPVTFEPMSAGEVSDVRGGYDWVQRVAAWGLWVGLTFLVLGFLIVPRKRWIIPKVLLGAGLTALVLWFVASKIEVQSLLDRLPDDTDAEFRSMVEDLVPQSRVDGVQSTLFKGAVLLLVLAALAGTLVWSLSRGKDRDHKKSDRPAGPAVVDVPPTEVPSPVPSSAAPSAVSAGPADPAGEVAATGSSASDVRVEGDTVIFGSPEPDAPADKDPSGSKG